MITCYLSCAHNIETHYKDIISHFQKADNNPNRYRHKDVFKALQALFFTDIAHYNYKGSCGLSRGLKWLAIMLHFSHGEA